MAGNNEQIVAGARLSDANKGEFPVLEVVREAVHQKTAERHISAMMTYPRDFDWESNNFIMPDLADQILSTTDQNGDVWFEPHPGQKVAVRLIRNPKKPWKVVIEKSGVARGLPYFKLKMTPLGRAKKDEVRQATLWITRSTQMIPSDEALQDQPAPSPVLAISVNLISGDPKKREAIIDLFKTREAESFFDKASGFSGYDQYALGRIDYRGHLWIRHNRSVMNISFGSGRYKGWTAIWAGHRVVGRVLEVDIDLIRPGHAAKRVLFQSVPYLRKSYAKVGVAGYESFAILDCELGKVALERLISSEEEFIALSTQLAGSGPMRLGSFNRRGKKTLIPKTGYYVQTSLFGFFNKGGWEGSVSDIRTVDDVLVFKVHSMNPNIGELDKYFYIDPKQFAQAQIQMSHGQRMRTSPHRVLKISPFIDKEDSLNTLNRIPRVAGQWTQARGGDQKELVVVSDAPSAYSLAMSRQISDALQMLSLSHFDIKVREAAAYFTENGELDGFLAEQKPKVQAQIKKAFAEALRPFAEGARLALEFQNSDLPQYLIDTLEAVRIARNIPIKYRESFAQSSYAQHMMKMAKGMGITEPSENLLDYFEDMTQDGSPQFYHFLTVLGALIKRFRDEFPVPTIIGNFEVKMKIAADIARNDMALSEKEAQKLIEYYFFNQSSAVSNILASEGQDYSEADYQKIVDTLISKGILRSKLQVGALVVKNISAKKLRALTKPLVSLVILEKKVNERFFNSPERQRWFRYLAFELSALGLRDESHPLISPKSEQAYRQIYAQLTNKGYDPDQGEVDYIYGGADITTALLTTNAKVIRIRDVLPYDDPSTAEPSDTLRFIYHTQKMASGYSSSELLEAIGSLKYPIRWELEARGAKNIREAKIDAQTHEITYLWSYDGKQDPIERKIIVTQDSAIALSGGLPAEQTNPHRVSIVKANLFHGNTFDPNSRFVISFEKNAPPDGYEAVALSELIDPELLRGHLHYDRYHGYADLGVGALFIKTLIGGQGARLVVMGLPSTLPGWFPNSLSGDTYYKDRIDMFLRDLEAEGSYESLANRYGIPSANIRSYMRNYKELNRRARSALLPKWYPENYRRSVEERENLLISAIVRAGSIDAFERDNHLPDNAVQMHLNRRAKLRLKLNEVMESAERQTSAKWFISLGMSNEIREEELVRQIWIAGSIRKFEIQNHIALSSVATFLKSRPELKNKIKIATSSPSWLPGYYDDDFNIRIRLLLYQIARMGSIDAYTRKHSMGPDTVRADTVRIYIYSKGYKKELYEMLHRARTKRSELLEEELRFSMELYQKKILRDITLLDAKGAILYHKIAWIRGVKTHFDSLLEDILFNDPGAWLEKKKYLTKISNAADNLSRRLVNGNSYLHSTDLKLLEFFLNAARSAMAGARLTKDLAYSVERIADRKPAAGSQQFAEKSSQSYALSSKRYPLSTVYSLLSRTRRTGSVVIGSTQFHVIMRDGQVLIYKRSGFKWSEPFVVDAKTIKRSPETGEAVALEMSQADLMAFLKTFSMKVDELDRTHAHIKNIPALAWDKSDRVLSEAELRYLIEIYPRILKADPTAVMVLDRPQARELYDAVLKKSPTLKNRLFMVSQDLPSNYRDVPRTVLEGVSAEDADFAEGPGRRLFVREMGDGAVYNYYDLLRLALIEARMGEMKTTNPVFVDFMRTVSDLLGEPIKDMEQFIKVLSGFERSGGIVWMYAFVPKIVSQLTQIRTLGILAQQAAYMA